MHPLESKRCDELIFKVASLDAAQKVSSLGLELQAKMCFVCRANPSSRKAQQSWIPHKSAQLCNQSYKLVQVFLWLWVLSPKIDLNQVTESKQHGQTLSLPPCWRGPGLFCEIHLARHQLINVIHKSTWSIQQLLKQKFTDMMVISWWYNHMSASIIGFWKILSASWWQMMMLWHQYKWWNLMDY